MNKGNITGGVNSWNKGNFHDINMSILHAAFENWQIMSRNIIGIREIHYTLITSLEPWKIYLERFLNNMFDQQYYEMSFWEENILRKLIEKRVLPIVSWHIICEKIFIRKGYILKGWNFLGKFGRKQANYLLW